ncbi:hypothetical protein Tco_0103152 [Tanacetum coccineum]
MSDSEHSTVTYTSVSEDDLYMGSPGVEGPIFEVPPSPDYIPGPEGPPSPDYVPGPEEPEQAPNLHSPFTYHLFRSLFTWSSYQVVTMRYSWLRSNHCLLLTHLLINHQGIYRSSTVEDLEAGLTEEGSEEISLLPPLPPPNGPTYVEGSLGSRAAGIRQRDALPSPIHETEMPEMWLPLRKRLCRTTLVLDTRSGRVRQLGIVAMDLVGASRRLHRPTSRGQPESSGVCLYFDTRMRSYISQLDDARALAVSDGGGRQFISCRLGTVDGCLRSDAFRGHITFGLRSWLAKYENSELPAATLDARASRLSMFEPSDTAGEPAKDSCRARATRGWPRKAHKNHEVKASHRNTHQSTNSPPQFTDPTTTTSVTSAQLQAMIDEGVTAVLAARATTRNGDDSHTSGTGARRNERTVRECTYQDFMKCQPLFFKGTEGVKMTTKYCPRNEIKKIEAELWNLKVQGTDVVAYNQRFQELACMSGQDVPKEIPKLKDMSEGCPT